MLLRGLSFLGVALAHMLHVRACGGDKPITLCCTGVAAWTNNEYVWGEICGYYPQDQFELIGARCITHPTGNCPPGTIATCCSGTWPGPSGQCALGTGCGAPTVTAPSELVRRETLPSGWFLLRFCGVDEANHVIIDDVVTTLSNNTPATCVEHCASLGLDYAGVENGNECHCGTGYTGGARAPTADCNIPCSGDPSLTCGGSWRIQIYTSDPNATD